MEGFHKHFRKLATTAADSEYRYNLSEIVNYEIDIIHELAKGKNIPTPTQKEVKDAIESIRKGKAADIFSIAIKHFVYGGEELFHFVHRISVAIFQSAVVPNIVKVGLLSPVFNSKGSITDVNNYRGITVLPVCCKIIDSILKCRVRPKSDIAQCSLQREFTQNSAPINAAFIKEESRREANDMEEQLIIIMLDAKSAFDVVVHNNMMMRLYHLGIQDKHWSLIQNLHSNATTSVKWNGHISDRFNIQQGVRQGGMFIYIRYMWIHGYIDYNTQERC
jgi:hypothetical protein